MMISHTKQRRIIQADQVDIRKAVVELTVVAETITTVTTSTKTNTTPSSMVDTVGSHMEWVTIRTTLTSVVDTALEAWLIIMECNKEAEIIKMVEASRTMINKKERREAEQMELRTRPCNKGLLVNLEVSKLLVCKVRVLNRRPRLQVVGRINPVDGVVVPRAGKAIRHVRPFLVMPVFNFAS